MTNTILDGSLSKNILDEGMKYGLILAALAEVSFLLKMMQILQEGRLRHLIPTDISDV